MKNEFKSKEEFEATIKELGLSKKDLAEIFGISINSVYNWNNGSIKIPYFVKPYLDLYKECKEYKTIAKLSLDKKL